MRSIAASLQLELCAACVDGLWLCLRRLVDVGEEEESAGSEELGDLSMPAR